MTKKKYKTFKDYYQEDEEFKKKHNAYMLEKIECPCGATISRCYKTRHLKSKLHQKRLGEKKEIEEIETEINKINKRIQKMKNQKKVLEKKLKAKKKIVE